MFDRFKFFLKVQFFKVQFKKVGYNNHSYDGAVSRNIPVEEDRVGQLGKGLNSRSIAAPEAVHWITPAVCAPSLQPKTHICRASDQKLSYCHITTSEKVMV